MCKTELLLHPHQHNPKFCLTYNYNNTKQSDKFNCLLHTKYITILITATTTGNAMH